MDALTELLDGVHARGALLNQAILEPPWSILVAEEAPLAFAMAARGHAWIVPRDDDSPVLMRAGDVAIINGSEPYVVAHDPALPPEIVVHKDGRYTTMDGMDVTDELRLGLRTCGESADGSVVVVSGTYQVSSDISERLLAALPRVLVVPEEEARCPLMDLLADEINKDEPGQQVVLDRLLDLALIATLRVWFARPDTQAPGWYGAQGDPVVGPALRLLHDDPSHPWTVALLANKVGVSRAALARRFSDLVGEPPMTYLTNWRIALAGDLLRRTDVTIESVARQVGYANAFALSVAFKRVRGVTPSQHRAVSSRSGER